MNDKDLKTNLMTPLEIKNYMSIMGATIIDNNSYILDGLKCCIDREYQGVCFENNLSPEIKKLFKEKSMEDSILGSIVFDLEGLVLIHTALKGENIEDNFENNLYQVRKQMLLRVIDNKNKIPFNGMFSDFDKTITPFLNDNFDYEKFLDECVFNTTGYYEKDGYDKCLKFVWKTKDNPDTIYSITKDIYGYYDSIINKKYYNQFFQKVYHINYNGEEKIQFFHGKDDNEIVIDFYPENNLMKQRVGGIYEETTKAKEFDIAKIKAIVNSFQDKDLSFEKSECKKRTLI